MTDRPQLDGDPVPPLLAEDEGRPPVLDQFDALLRRHRPNHEAVLPVLEEEESESIRGEALHLEPVVVAAEPPAGDLPVLTEVADEYHPPPLLDDTARAELVDELVTTILMELTPRIEALVRAKLGLQIGGLMRVVTEEVSNDLREDWRRELKRKIERRVLARLDEIQQAQSPAPEAPDDLAPPPVV